MVERSLKPNGSGVQFDNFLGDLLSDPDHRGVAHCMIRTSGKEGDQVISLIERRTKRRKGGLEVGIKVHGVEDLLDRWSEVTVEVWIKAFTIRKLLDEITLRDLKPALQEYEAAKQGFITIETSRIFDGFPDVRAIEARLKELLSSNGHGAIDVRTLRGHWSPGLQLVTVRLQPEGPPQLEMGDTDGYPIPSLPPKKR